MEQTDVIQLRKRFFDLANMADRKNIVTFSNFLNMNELNEFHQLERELPVSYQLSGGYEFAERQMVAFIPDALYYEWSFPICCIKYSPAYPKFAEELNHRDVLGALMNLGIERSRIGDIKLLEKDAYVFCEETLAEYLCSAITTMRHTVVSAEFVSLENFTFEQKYEQIFGTISSERLDTIISFLTNQSRSQSVMMIQSQKVFVNNKLVTSNAYFCKTGDVLSLRGYGKFIFDGVIGQTRKQKLKVALRQYI